MIGYWDRIGIWWDSTWKSIVLRGSRRCGRIVARLWLGVFHQLLVLNLSKGHGMSKLWLNPSWLIILNLWLNLHWYIWIKELGTALPSYWPSVLTSKVSFFIIMFCSYIISTITTLILLVNFVELSYILT